MMQNLPFVKRVRYRRIGKQSSLTMRYRVVMASAVMSIVSKTVDVLLKIQSTESKRQKWGKLLFSVYNALGDVESTMYRIVTTLTQFTEVGEGTPFLFGTLHAPDYILIGSISSNGMMTVQTKLLREDGAETLSEIKNVPQRDLLPLVLSNDIQTFTAAFHKLSRLMGAETWDLFQVQNQPEQLKALGIYDEEVARVLIKAWFMDGGFVEAFNRIGLSYLFEEQLVRMSDAPFDPESNIHGYAVNLTETDYKLTDSEDVQRLISIVTPSRSAVVAARDELKKFIAKSFKIEDII